MLLQTLFDSKTPKILYSLYRITILFFIEMKFKPIFLNLRPENA